LYHYSARSKDNIETCHPNIQRVLRKVLLKHDHVVLWGFRGQYEQDRAFSEGNSTKKYPHSKHNKMLSKAVDIAPYINGRMVNGDQEGDIEQICYFAGYVMAVADEMGVSLSWGGNWDGDEVILTDQKFDDLFHFELI